MSAPPKFKDLPEAIAAYRAGRSRRWADVAGHQVDLHAAANPCGVSRPGADSEPVFVGGVPLIVAEPGALPYGCDAMFVAPIVFDDEHDRAMYDRNIADNIAAELARAAHVLPELAPPEVPAPTPVECCRACGRPLIGEVTP